MEDNNLAKITLVIGELRLFQGEDWETIEHVALKVLYNWQNKVDIQSEEEEGYIMVYARRVL